MSDVAPASGRVRTAASALRSRFRLIALAPVLVLVAVGAWAFASPAGSAPDDEFHLASIWCANDARTDLCKPGTKEGERYLSPALVHVSCYAYDPTHTPVCQDQFLTEPEEPTELTARGSFENNYPPLYYGFMNLFASNDMQVSAVIMRLVNALLFVGISTALYLLLPVRRRPTLVWTFLVTMVPLGLFVLASDNPSSWSIIGVGMSWLALVGFFETAGRRRIALGALFGLTVLMAAGSRADAAVYTIIGSTIAGFLTFERTRSWLKSAILPVVFAVLGLYFFVSSRQVAVVATGLGDSSTGTGLDKPTLFAYNFSQLPNLWVGSFGVWNLGWLDTVMPPIVWVGALAAFVGVVFVGLGRSSRRKTLGVIGLGLALFAIPMYVLVQGDNAVGTNVQPRYILPLIIMLAGVATFVVGTVRVGLSAVQLWLIGAILAIAQSFALYTNIRRYVTGSQSSVPFLDTAIEWWWSGPVVSPMTLWFIGSLAFTGLLFVLLREMRKTNELAA